MPPDQHLRHSLRGKHFTEQKENSLLLRAKTKNSILIKREAVEETTASRSLPTPEVLSDSPAFRKPNGPRADSSVHFDGSTSSTPNDDAYKRLGTLPPDPHTPPNSDANHPPSVWTTETADAAAKAVNAVNRRALVKSGLIFSGRMLVKTASLGVRYAYRAGSVIYQSGNSKNSEYLAVEEAVEALYKNKVKRAGLAISRKAGKYADKGAKAVVRGVGKLLAALGRAAVKAVATASAPVLLAVCAVAILGIAVSSAFGVIFDDGDPTTPTMEELVTLNEQRLQAQIDAIYESVQPVDVVLMDFYGFPDPSSLPARLNNWPDVIAVWAVRTTMIDGLDVIKLDEQKEALLQQMFDRMIAVDHTVSVETRTQTVVDAEGKETEVEVVIKTLLYAIRSRQQQSMYADYRMSKDEVSIAEELRTTPEFQELVSASTMSFNPFPYPRTGGGYSGTIVDFSTWQLPPSDVANEVVRIALGYLGTPYSILDCSKLTQTVFKELGINLPRTAAGQAKYIIDSQKAISKSDLQIGDLIFYALKGDNGRYMHVSHVAIYAGNGMIIDASSINGYTMYREMDTFSDRTTVLYGRP